MAYELKSHLPQSAEDRSNGASAQSIGDTAQSAYDWVADTARNNPVLVVGGALAIGALVAMAVTSRATPQSRVRSFEKRIRREVASAERTLRRSVDNSGIASSLAEIPAMVASRVGSWDTAQLDALKDRASHLAGQIAARASSVLGTR